MAGAPGNILSPSLQNQLSAIKRTQRALDVTTLRLASGLDVNSALDNPQNFFTSRSLSDRARDLIQLLDGINQNIRAVQQAISGTQSLIQLLDQAESIAQETKAELAAGRTFPNLTHVIEEEVSVSPTPLSTVITSDSPVAYYRLNDLAGPALQSSGNPLTFNGTYQNGVVRGAAALYTNGATFSADFDGVNDRVAIPDSTLINTQAVNQRTVELVFNADNVTPRQVLYEEGGATNGLAIYVDNGRVFVTGEDDNGANRFANINISAPIVAGQTYHVGFVFDRFTQTFTGYLDGQVIGTFTVFNEAFPAHTGNTAIGGVDGAAQFHDGETSAASGFNFNGRISDVAIYNTALQASDFQERFNSLNSSTSFFYPNTEYENILEQIDRLLVDAQYRGINLLQGDDLLTIFNEDNTSVLKSEGAEFSIGKLRIGSRDFRSEVNVDTIIATAREVREQVRSYGRTLATDLSIIETRRDFTRSLANTLLAGAEDLTVANQNEEGANLLALQTRQQIQTSVLGFRAPGIADFLL